MIGGPDYESFQRGPMICSQVGALVCVNDFIGRESRALPDGGTFATGMYRFRYCRTPHLPHGWDAMWRYARSSARRSKGGISDHSHICAMIQRGS